MNLNFRENDSEWNPVSVRRADPMSDVSLEPFTEDDIEEIYGEYEVNNEWDSHGFAFGKVKDGRYFCEYWSHDMTFSDEVIYIAKTREEIELYGLDPEERQMYGVTQGG